MTKTEAISAMEQGGYKVAHSLFSADEWIAAYDEDYFVDESGLMIQKDEFWKFRTGKIWENNGWRTVGQKRIINLLNSKYNIMTDKAKQLGDEPINPYDASIQRQSALYSGLTKREYFAAMVLQGALSNTNYYKETKSGYIECAVRYADALLEELSKEN